MDFSRVELSDADQAFRDEARSFLGTHVTDEVRRRDRETGDNFDEGLHLASSAPQAIWPRSGSPNPKAGSAGCGGVSGSWRSGGRTCRG